MSLISRIENLAQRKTEIERVVAIIKAAATVLSKAGRPTKVVFGKPKQRLPTVPSGKPGAGVKRVNPTRGKRLRRRSDGSPFLEGAYSDSDIDFRDIDFQDIDFQDIDFQDHTTNVR